MPDRINVDGWLVAQIETDEGWPQGSSYYGGRLFLFRTGRDWTLLTVEYVTRWGEQAPESGSARAWASTHPDLAAVKAEVQHYGRSADWRELVKAGAENDDELRALWTPVQIDLDLDKSSIHRRELGVHGELRRQPDWRAAALALAVARLEALGYVVLQATVEYRDVFQRGLPREWSNPVVAAVVASRYSYRADLVVAVDGFGEVYVRTVDGGAFDPGAPRRFAPRPLTEREARQVEDIYRRRRDEALRRMEEEER